MSPSAAMADTKTVMRLCFMAMIAAMKKVCAPRGRQRRAKGVAGALARHVTLSPSSLTTIMDTPDTKAGKKSREPEPDDAPGAAAAASAAAAPAAASAGSE
jgi:hypothetical protein